MSNISKNDLKVQSGNTYIDNNSGLIVPSNIRSFNTDLIDSLASQDDYATLSASFAGLSGSYAVDDASIASLNSATSSYITNAQTASMAVASASYSEYALTASYALNGGTGGNADTASLLDTASFNAYTASQASKGYATTGSNTFVDDQVFSRNVTIDGTASINYLFANVISQSVIYSSGSNTLGDNVNDVQTLVGTTNIVGTLKSTNAILTGSFKGDLTGNADTATSASYAYSASNADTASYVNLENDTLAFQNRTGILKGGTISVGAGRNKFTVAEGKGQIVSQSLEGPNYIKTSKVVVQWSTRANIDLDYLLTNEVTFVYVDAAGDVYQQTGSFTNGDLRDKIVLGSITHGDNLYIDSVENDQIVGYNSYKADEYVNIFGVSKIKGLQPLTIAGTNQLSINSGSVYHNGANYTVDQWNANTKEVSFVATASFTRVYASASTYVFDNSASLAGPQFYDHLDFDHYVSGGVIVSASTGFFTTQRIYQHPENPDKLFAYYGPQEYQVIDDAVNAIAFEKFEESEGTKFNTAFLGYIVGKQGTNNLEDPSNGVIIYSGINRSIFLSTGTNIGALATPLTALTYCYNAPAVTWSLQHNLNVDYPVITAYKSGSKEVILPNTIKSVDSNMIDLYFAYPFAGCVTVAAAGAQIIQAPFQPGGLPTQSFNTWTGSTDSQFSGTASFALTASYVLGSGAAGSATSASWASSSLSSSVAQRAITASNSDTASLAITASYTETASYIATSSYAFRSERSVSSSYASSSFFSTYAFSAVSSSASFTAVSSSYSVKAVNADIAISSSYAESSSYAVSTSIADRAVTASFANTSSWAIRAITASHALWAVTASNAQTASSADNLYVRGTLRVDGVISASILYAESSSVAFTSGSNRIGNALTDTQAITGSVGVTGSFVMAADSRAVIANLTASLFGTASFALTSSYGVNASSASYVSGSSILVQDTIAVGTGSVRFLKVTASAILGTANTNVTHSVYGQSDISGTVRLLGEIFTIGRLDLRGAFVTGTLTGYLDGSGSYAVNTSQSILAQTASRIEGELVIGTVTSSLSSSLASLATTALTASRITGSGVIGIVNASVTSSISVSSSFASTASYVISALTSSWISGSNVVGTVASSFSSSLSVSASLSRTASYVVLSQTASYVDTARTASFITGAVLNFPDPYSTTATVNNIVTLTSAEYTGLLVKNANTFYIVI